MYQQVKVGRNPARILALFLLVFTLTAARCNDDQTRQAAKIADDISIAIKGCLDVADQLKTEKRITFEQWQDINKKLLVVNSSGKVFFEEVQKAKTGGQWDANVKAAIAASFVNLNNEIKTINSAGIFNLQDPEAHKRLQAVLTSLNTAASLMQGLLSSN